MVDILQITVSIFDLLFLLQEDLHRFCAQQSCFVPQIGHVGWNSNYCAPAVRTSMLVSMLPHDEELVFVCILVIAEELKDTALHFIMQVQRASVWEVYMLDNCEARLNRVYSAIFA